MLSDRGRKKDRTVPVRTKVTVKEASAQLQVVTGLAVKKEKSSLEPGR
jgi:hypothetical protein